MWENTHYHHKTAESVEVLKNAPLLGLTDNQLPLCTTITVAFKTKHDARMYDKHEKLPFLTSMATKNDLLMMKHNYNKMPSKIFNLKKYIKFKCQSML